MRQKQVFLESEGDRYFDRNAHMKASPDDPVIAAVDTIGRAPKRILEIGCSNGWRLRHFLESGAHCAGIDPSEKAIGSGDGMDLRVGTADELPFETNSFDLVIFGFCLYLVDPVLHFKSVAEADRVLSDGGMIAIYDFIPSIHYFNDYSHLAGVRSYKMEFAKYFLANPAYSLVHRHLSVFKGCDERMGVDVLLKDQAGAFQRNPY